MNPKARRAYAAGFAMRLAGEMQRIGLARQDLAEGAGAALTTVDTWLQGKSAPNAKYLLPMGALGIDWMYLLTGLGSDPFVHALRIADELAETLTGDRATNPEIATLAAAIYPLLRRPSKPAKSDNVSHLLQSVCAGRKA